MTAPVSGEHLETDVLIVGSGPIGATFARSLVAAGRRVLMIDAGPQLGPRPGEHLKNAFAYQRDPDRFADIIRGLLHPVSVPPGVPGHNPRQDPAAGMPGAAVSFGVGGMFTHWTSQTPRQHPQLERGSFIDTAGWDLLYDRAEALVGTRTDLFDGSVRHQAIIRALGEHYGRRLPEGYGVQSLPMAGQRHPDHPGFVRFSGTDTVLGPLVDGAAGFRILANHRCRRLVHGGGVVRGAEVEDVRAWRTLHIAAATTIVACGPILTPQLLFASGIRPPALGRYLHEHPMACGQIVIPGVLEGEPIPENDPPPMVWVPVSEDRPWHAQVHRNWTGHEDLPPGVDDRVVVDLTWFGMVDPVASNRIAFEENMTDRFGMPMPTFEYRLGDDDRQRGGRMMADLEEAAAALGDYVGGRDPQWLSPGSSLGHLQGTTRIGAEDDGTSVVDPSSRVWGFTNLLLGGTGLIPDRNACNPTLTAMALALRAADTLVGH
jgi:choline dehydrogenase-like flavoprotein